MSSKKKAMIIAFCGILAFFAVCLLWIPPVKPDLDKQSDEPQGGARTSVFTCSMHPQIRLPKGSKCPLCGMGLIPVSSNFASECDPRELKLSESAERLAAIATVTVERKFVPVEIRMLGKIAYNANALSYVNSRFAGRIDRLFVESPGIAVNKGDRLAEVYSQELRVLLLELVQALNVKESKPNDVAAVTFLNSVIEKYRFSGFSEDQLTEIISKLKGAERLTFVNSQVSGMMLSMTSPISGVLIDKIPVTGKYFDKGEVLFTVADLSRIWINVEAYETDLPWLKYGQEVEFTTEACPGKKFKGRITLIQPILDETTRTVKVRIAADNIEGRLKPGMFVDAVICAKIAEGGKVVDSSLVGKWVGAKHPDVIRDAPGTCDICGTSLVTAESLGHVGEDDKNIPAPLVIPASAPLITGKRAVVYVAVPGKRGVYEGREVGLGPRCGNYFIVESGLKAGESVVTSGNFKLDSSFQILAKSSMMSLPMGGGAVFAGLGQEVKEKNSPPSH
ncbi:MAG: efflux RND transporter periplasmic adaptor subunit [Victivallales bacterium]|jgi:Cu(I)/Ag(I) efflux system membrane fusion protein